MNKLKKTLFLFVLFIVSCRQNVVKNTVSHKIANEKKDLLDKEYDFFIKSAEKSEDKCSLYERADLISFLRSKTGKIEISGKNCKHALFFKAVQNEMNGDFRKAAALYLKYISETSGVKSETSDFMRIYSAYSVLPEIPDIYTARKILKLEKSNPGLFPLRTIKRAMSITGENRDYFILPSGISVQRRILKGKYDYLSVIYNHKSEFSEFKPFETGYLKSESGNYETAELKLDFECKVPSTIRVSFKLHGAEAISFDDKTVFSRREYGIEYADFKVSAGKHVLSVYPVISRIPFQPELKITSMNKGCKTLEGQAFKQYYAFTPDSKFLSDKLLKIFLEERIALTNGNIFSARKFDFKLRKLLKTSMAADYLKAKALYSDDTLPPHVKISKLFAVLDKKPVLNWKKILKSEYLLNNSDFEKALKVLKGCFVTGCVNLQAEILSKSDKKKAENLLFDLIESSKADYKTYLLAAETARAGNITARKRWIKQASILNPGGTDTADFYLQTGKIKEAVSIFEKLHKKNPYDLKLLNKLYIAYLKSGNIQKAASCMDLIYSLNPGNESSSLRKADILKAYFSDDKATSFMVSHIKQYPAHTDFLAVLNALGKLPISDTELPVKLRKRLLKDKEWSSAIAVLLLNRMDTYLFKNGAGFNLIHRLVRVQSMEGADELGEITLPDQAFVLKLRTVKKDGKTVLPAFTPEKNSYSMRNLEEGDVIEIKYLLPLLPLEGMNGSFMGGRFSFRHKYVPGVLSVYSLHVPPGSGAGFIKRNYKLEPEITKTKDFTTYRFSMWYQNNAIHERRTAGFWDITPNVQAYVNLTPESFRSLLKEDLPWFYGDSFDIYRKTAEICGNSDKNVCAHKLLDMVKHEIEQYHGITDPAEIFFKKRGSRTILLWNMLRYAGIKSDILYAAPKRKLLKHKIFPDTSIYYVPMIRLPGGEISDLRYEYLPSGTMVPAFGGSEALDFKSENLITKLPPAPQSKKFISGRLKINDDFSGVINITVAASGFSAVKMKTVFLKTPPGKLMSKIETITLNNYFPGATLFKFEKKRLKPDVAFEYGFKVPVIVYSTDSVTMEVKRFAFPWRLAERYKIYDERKTPLLPSSMPEVSLTLKIIPPKGMKIKSQPAFELKSKYGYILRKIRVYKGFAILKIKKKLSAERIETKDFKEFADFAKEFDSYEQLPVVLTK